MTTEKINTEVKKDYKFRFGRQENGDHPRPVIPNIHVRYLNTYLVGMPGMGKSSLMERLAVTDIDYGAAVIYIDPKGTSVKKLRSLYPHVKYISIRDPIVINPLDKPQYHIEDIIQEFYTIVDTLIKVTTPINPPSSVWMKETLGNAIRIIDKEQNKNLEYLVDFLQYDTVRARIVPTIKNQKLKDYWIDFDAQEKNARYPKNKEKILTAQRVASRLSEISQGRMRNFVIGKNQLDIADIVSKGEVVLVDTSHMSYNARIYLTNLIVYSILSYADFLQTKPKPLMLYIDEFQIVVSDWFAEILARLRDKLVGFTLAHQSFSQIPKNLLSTILDCTSTKVSFRVGDEPASRLKDYFNVTSKDLLNLSKYQAWVRIDTGSTLTTCSKPIEEKEFTEINFLADAWI